MQQKRSGLLQRFLRLKESGPILFIVFFVLFSWPFLGMRALEKPKWVVGYLFGVWALLIIIHWFQDQIQSKSEKKNDV